jgi:hypothetical protein
MLIIELLAKIPAEYVGAAGGTLVVVVTKAIGPIIAKAVTGAWKRNDVELEALGQREKEVVMAADEFSKDNEIQRLNRRVALEQTKNDELERENLRLESRVRALESIKHDLEMELQRRRAEIATGKHKALPPHIEDVTDRLDTERPRSASRQLPPIPTGPMTVRPK